MTDDAANLKKTPLNGVEHELGGKMVDFGGWELPVQFSGILEEHAAVREHVGLFDVSHMGELTVKGPDALTLLQRATCNDVSKLENGRAQYNGLLYPTAGFVDDILIYQNSTNDFFIVVNASNTDKDYEWIADAAKGMDVEVRNVSKLFKRDAFEVKALEDVSIDIATGEFLALMGPSGSGKTTLLNMIAAIDRPTSGELLVMGENVFRFGDGQAARWRNEHIGYVFQTFNLIPVLTAFENVELPLLLTKLNQQQRRDHVMTALKLVGLEDRVNHLPKQLSGGQEQRVAIARAIVSDPTLLLADEPTGDLDSHSATEILEILKRLNEDFHKTIVMVTHDPHAASYAHVSRHLEKGMLLPPA